MEMLIIALLASVMLVVYDDEMQNEMITQFVGERDANRGGEFEGPSDWAWQRLLKEGANCKCCGSQFIEKVDHECTYSFVSDDHEDVEFEYRFYVDCIDCGESFTLMGYYS
tara:strand:- start:303 stop:635 length:333 start_codon:yes stop_codon:yes gene_type:complete